MAITAEAALFEWADSATRRSMTALMRFNQSNNLSISTVNTLFHAFRLNHVTVNELARHLGVSMPAASQMVARMVEQGWVKREESAHDRRERIISLTEDGIGLVTRAKIARHAWINDFMANLTEAEKQKVLPGLELLNQKMTLFNAEADKLRNESKEN
jgi:DNA-binding MarR family transcriptional regulator